MGMVLEMAAERRFAKEPPLEVWKRYRQTGDPALRNRLVLTFVPLVKHIAYKKLRELPATCEVEDLVSSGIEALIGALDRFDPDKGASLEPYLWTRIHGAILDELRRRDWAPRSLRRLEREIRKARDGFTGTHGRAPTSDELADMMGMDTSELHDREREIENSEVTSLSSLVITPGETEIDATENLRSDDRETDPERVVAWSEAKERFRAAFDRLPDRQREVAVLLYVKDLTLREIGEVLGVSESRVCQIHGELKRNIRRRLSADESLFSIAA